MRHIYIVNVSKIGPQNETKILMGHGSIGLTTIELN
jgi:hypothetical protein